MTYKNIFSKVNPFAKCGRSPFKRKLVLVESLIGIEEQIEEGDAKTLFYRKNYDEGKKPSEVTEDNLKVEKESGRFMPVCCGTYSVPLFIPSSSTITLGNSGEVYFYEREYEQGRTPKIIEAEWEEKKKKLVREQEELTLRIKAFAPDLIVKLTKKIRNIHTVRNVITIVAGVSLVTAIPTMMMVLFYKINTSISYLSEQEMNNLMKVAFGSGGTFVASACSHIIENALNDAKYYKYKDCLYKLKNILS
ncbi:MAG: hypothetical protein WC356_02535 [Candidatus Micrarchaeia archaeon]|jgi:hypothetical protein